MRVPRLYGLFTGWIFIVPRLLCHVISFFAVSLDAQPPAVAMCDKQGVMRSYSDPRFQWNPHYVRHFVDEIGIKNY